MEDFNHLYKHFLKLIPIRDIAAPKGRYISRIMVFQGQRLGKGTSHGLRHFQSVWRIAEIFRYLLPSLLMCCYRVVVTVLHEIITCL